ncbi:MAG: hypothetical protein KDE56_34155, partial [Anaerolineales bacterium]|nr:hypothetical protein [Anaerolineales bacterium]
GLKLRLLSIKGKSMNDLSATSNLQNLIALDVRRCPSIKKWFDIEKTPNLCAIWTDDPTNLPKDIEKTIQINPNLNPSDFVRQLESKQKKKD